MMRIAIPAHFWICIIAFLQASASLAAEDSDWHRVEETRPMMGSTVNIVAYVRQPKAGRDAIQQGFDRIEHLNSIFSDYELDSECSRLSRAAPTSDFVPVSDEMWHLLRQSVKLSRASHGAFDVTVGPLSRLWRRARRRKELPSRDRLNQAMASVDYRHLQIHESKPAIKLAKPGMRLDFGGIAKGYAADQALRAIRAAGVDRALVNAGGDIAIGSAPPEKDGWKIGVAPLRPEQPPGVYLTLENCGVATSGDAWQFLEIDGRRFSHIIDPRTGWGVSERSTVTVLAGDCSLADGLASAVSVLGHQQGIALIERTAGAACFIVHVENDTTKTHRSKRFPTGEAP